MKSIIYLILLLFVYNSSVAQQAIDESGKITVAIFNKTSEVSRQHGRLEIPVPPDFIVVGGGAVASKEGKGALLTASFPNEQLSSWVVASKDHQEAHPHKLQGYAIGLKVQGMTREQLRSFISLSRVVSEAKNHPFTQARPAAGNVLIGGGFEVLWTGPGNLATASYPDGGAWRVRSKDHIVPDVAQIVAYAISIRPDLPVGRIRATINSGGSQPTSHPQHIVNLPIGYAMTCGGGYAAWTGEGNMLWQLKPTIDQKTRVQSFTAGAKDHIRPSTGSVFSYVLGLKIE